MASLALAAGKISVSALSKDTDKFDGKPVEVEGKVSGFEQKTSKKGNKYFIFKMKEGEASVSVYSHGEPNPAIKDGDKVSVQGIFRKEKKIGTFTVKNEIDATPVKEKPYGVKKLP